MKKNFFKNLNKISKSLNKSANKIFSQSRYQKPQNWWPFNEKHKETKNDPLNKFKDMFFSKPKNESSNSFDKLAQQIKNLASKQNQALFQSYKNKLGQTAEKSKKVYSQKANEIKTKLQQTLKQTKIPLNQQHLELLKKKTSQAGQIFSNKASSLKENITKATQQISKKSQEIPNKLGEVGKISGKVYEEIKEKVNVKKNVQKTFSYIFWRTALLLGIVAFAYGLGTSLPRELRSVLKELYNSDNRQVNDNETLVGKSSRIQQGR